ncbi:MAG: hypothetical protein Q9217_003652 [Psora testacea]
MSPNQPQAFISSYAPRLRAYGNALLTPIIPQTVPTVPSARTTKRGTIAKNYAEDDYDDEDIFEDSETTRRHTGLRTRREDPNQAKEGLSEKRLGKEIHAPVDVQGIWRDWMGKLRIVRTDKQHHAQTNLPLTLIPIRIDVDIASYTPQPALPLPPNAHELGINPALPPYRTPDPTPSYRLKDVFLWNLHETLITPDQFATILIHDLDLPNSTKLSMEISNQIRSQLEEYAGVALHPLFHSTDTTAPNGNVQKSIRTANSREQSSTPALLGPNTPLTNGANGHKSPTKTPNPEVSAQASPLPSRTTNNELDPDDTYRCIVTLNINLQNKLFTDKFEWSLLHPVGLAERFSKQTCADLGLSGEWVPAMAHAIYEAVLRLKKEACESGGLVGSYGAEIDNMAASEAGAGWRFDNEHLGDEWEPKLERLSKEEIEKREGDRERQLRRLRRETARFSSTTNMAGGLPEQRGAEEEAPMGRGERSKKKRRFRSLSPVGRGTPEVGNAGYGGGGVGTLTDWCVLFPASLVV